MAARQGIAGNAIRMAFASAVKPAISLNMLPEERHERRAQYFRTIFDALPLPMFIVDADVCILDFNTAAEQFLGPESTVALNRRAGEAFHCIHSEPHGCGCSANCRNCVIRHCVAQAMAGGSACRQRHGADLGDGREAHRLDLLVTAALLPYAEPPQAVLVLENLTALIEAKPLKATPRRRRKQSSLASCSPPAQLPMDSCRPPEEIKNEPDHVSPSERVDAGWPSMT